MYLGIALGALFSLSSALYTPKGSSCAVACGTKAQNFTGTGDLVCLDTAYDDNTKGVLFKQCISCLSNSTYINDAVSYNGNSDQYWYLCMCATACVALPLTKPGQGTSSTFSSTASSILLKPLPPRTALPNVTP